MLNKVINRIKEEPALAYGVVTAALALLMAFGVSLSKEQTGAILALVSAVLAFAIRRKVVPVAKLEKYQPKHRA